MNFWGIVVRRFLRHVEFVVNVMAMGYIIHRVLGIKYTIKMFSYALAWIIMRLKENKMYQ